MRSPDRSARFSAAAGPVRVRFRPIADFAEVFGSERQAGWMVVFDNPETAMATQAAVSADRRIVSTAELTGSALFDRGGHKIGVIKELLLDRRTGEMQFVLATTGGVLGIGDKFHPLPWSLLTYRDSPEGYVAAFGKDELKDAPAYDRDQISSPAYGWDEQVHRYFQGLGLRSGAPA